MQYHILTNPSPEGGFTGQCMELPGAISEGETLEELTKNMREAIDLVLESIQAQVKQKPEQVIEIVR
jgi:predicted RNase H-like HicB family nuclease